MKIQNRLQKIFEIPLGKYLRINLWILPILFCSAIGGYWFMFILTYISAIVHELAHILCAKAFNVGISKVYLYPFGISARLDGGYIRSSEKEFFIAISGPVASLMLFCVFEILHRRIALAVLGFAADANLWLCIINLVPALPLDGGRVIKSMLTARYGIIRAYNFMLRFSRFVIFLLMAAAVFVFFVSDFNFSLILISAFLLQNLCCEQQAVTIITLKEILSNSQKTEAFDTLPAKAVCVSEQKAASGILKLLSYDYFYIICILDKNSNITKIVTETQVLSALTSHGIRLKYSDI